MLKSVLCLLLRVLGAVFVGGMLFTSAWLLCALPSMSWDLLRWEYYAAVRSGRTEDFNFTFVRGILHVALFVAFVAAILALAALFCGIIGWNKQAAKIWGLFDYLHVLGKEKCGAG